MTQHLGSWVTALADGQLGPAESERALAHVAGCGACAEQLAVARQASRTLSVVPDAEPTPDLTARLLALGSPPPRGAVPAGTRTPGTDRSAPVVPLGSSAYASPARALSGDVTACWRPGLRFAGGLAAAVVVVAAALFVLGAPAAVVPSAYAGPALTMLGASGPSGTAGGTWAPGLADRITATAVSATGGSGASADGAVMDWMDDAGWVWPRTLPDGYGITSARLVGEAGAGLEVDLAGPAGRIVVTQERGRLMVAALRAAARLQAGDRAVYVLSRQPWHAAWQSGDTVVTVVSEGYTPTVARLVADFPAAGYDDGLLPRLARGWNRVWASLPDR